MPSSKRFRETLDRLAAAEASAFASEFLAPLIRGRKVRLRIAGVVCQFKISPADYEGWGVFRPTSPHEAEVVRSATLSERKQYLELLPRLRVILCARKGKDWLAIPASRADSRFQVQGLLPVGLVEEAQLFEVILSRFDGAHFWYEGPDPRHDPAMAGYLRESLVQMVEPDQLCRPGLTAEERAAYVVRYAPLLEAEIEARRDRTEERLRAALAHAGAELREYLEHGDIYRVTYDVDGRRHVSVVDQQNLSVQVAGICLSGEDRHFDLQSLVGVLREARGGGREVRVGFENEGMPEQDYWNVHPPVP
jgi:hypothetical protein